jgi:hypothetical protein
MSACESLPQELITAIVDNIRDDKKSLGAFSLVCKCWTNPARDHLFATLTISDFGGHLEKIKAASITSTFTPFLRDLRLMTSYSGTFWQEVIPFLATFRTPRLRSLAFSDFKLHSLSPDERSAFFRRFESIVSLTLCLYQTDASNDIATIICSFPRLRNLHLVPSLHKYPLPGTSTLSPELRLPERLSTLRVACFSQDYRLVLEWLASIPEQLSIHTLELSLHSVAPQDIVIMNVFLKALGPSLEVFRCSSGMFIPPVPAVVFIDIYPP